MPMARRNARVAEFAGAERDALNIECRKQEGQQCARNAFRHHRHDSTAACAIVALDDESATPAVGAFRDDSIGPGPAKWGACTWCPCDISYLSKVDRELKEE